MPKLRKSTSEIKNVEFRAVLDGNMQRTGLTQYQQVAEAIGISPQTMSYKRRKPETITLGELRRMIDKKLLTVEDFEKIL